MPIEIHSKCIDALVKAIATALDAAMLTQGVAFDFESLGGLVDADRIPPKKTAEQLESVIGENPVFTFTYDAITKQLRDGDARSFDAPSAPLKSVDGFRNAEEVARSIVTSMQSLPWKYTIISPLLLPANCGIPVSPDNGVVEFGPHLAFVRPPDSMKDKYPLPKEKPLFSFLGHDPVHSAWDSDQLYALCKTSGYIAEYVATPILRAFQSDVRSVLGLGLALHLFDRSASHLFRIGRREIITYRIVDKNPMRQSEHWFSREDSDVISSLRVVDLPSATALQRLGWISDQTGLIVGVMNAKDRHSKVLQAAEWFFESYCGTNEILSFVQVTVALEILLGDKNDMDNVGVGTLLANRAAYLLGKTGAERAKLLESVKSLYNTRSRIVHDGRRGLNSEERSGLRDLRLIVRRLIRKEIELAI